MHIQKHALCTYTYPLVHVLLCLEVRKLITGTYFFIFLARSEDSCTHTHSSNYAYNQQDSQDCLQLLSVTGLMCAKISSCFICNWQRQFMLFLVAAVTAHLAFTVNVISWMNSNFDTLQL